MSTIAEALLQKPLIDSLDYELIIACVINQSREFVLAHPEHLLAQEKIVTILAFAQRRECGEPLAHILGHKEFFGLDFKITKDTLIPRPETELMIEALLLQEAQRKNTHSMQQTIFIDIGTGSGAILISLFAELSRLHLVPKSSHFFGVDISPAALLVAQENADQLLSQHQLQFLTSDLLVKLTPKLLRARPSRIVIAANLPYLSTVIYESSLPNVKIFEPRSALWSSEEGLAHYRRLLEMLWLLSSQLKQTSFDLFFEISPEQKTAAEKMILSFFPKAQISTHKDLAKKYRLTITHLI
jgi:release factor glutamine methyltransferase